MISIQENSSLKCDNVSAVASITGLQSDIQLENSRFRYEIKNVLWLEGSKLTMSASNAHGGLVMKDKSFYSTVRATNANCHFIRSTISMSETSPALYVIDSQVVVEESVCDALQSEASTLELKQTRIEKFLHIYRSSKLIAESVLIMGYDARKINFFATKNVKIEVSNLVFAYASQPMIRLDKSVAFDVKQVRQLVDSGQGAHFFAATAANDLNYRPEKIVIDYMTVVSPSEKLHKMIGMTSVKRNVEEFVAVAQLNKRREKQGLGTSEMTMHSLFLGNPGTGKTSVARIIGQILFEKGVIEKPKFVETSRSDLVGGYIGQTAIKTREVLEKARGGVLFIDEAYTLSVGTENDFGLEAVNEILKFMEDNRNDIVIIFAGYEKQMDKFLNMNEGLRSRIPNRFMFDDYTVEELVQIGEKELMAQHFSVPHAAYQILVVENLRRTNDHSNGRWIRNLNEQLIRKVALRIQTSQSEELSTITQADLEAVRLKDEKT